MIETGLKVLMISTDRKIFDTESAVAQRMKDYGNLVEELHIVVLTDRGHGFKEKKLSSHVWLYPTNSSFKVFRPRNAAKLGKKIVFDKKFIRGRSLITTQDPFETGWAGLKIKKKWRLPLEVQLHTNPFSPEFSGHLNSVRRRLAKKVLPQADHIRVVSEFLKSLLLTTYLSRATCPELCRRKSRDSLLPTTISVLPIYVDIEKMKSASPTFDLHSRFGWQFILLTVSRLSSEKNISLMLKIISLLRQRYPSIGLVIVGSGPEEGKLKLLAKELDVERNVAFEGWKNDLHSYYKTANAYIQTSRFEGYGMSLIEAGLAGLPIVTTKVGIAGDFENGKEAYICPKNDVGYFANAIADLIDNNQHRENLRINMKNFLERTLLSKEKYLSQLKKNWKETAKMVL